MEKLAVLKAWAEVYVVALQQEQAQTSQVYLTNSSETAYCGLPGLLQYCVTTKYQLTRLMNKRMFHSVMSQ